MKKNTTAKSNGISQPADLKALIQRASLTGIAVILAAGITYTGCSISGLGDVSISGSGATISSELKFEDCGKVSLEKFTLLNGNPYGVMVVGCKGLYIAGIEVGNCTTTAILVANTSNVTIEGSHCYGSKKQHGIYISQSCDNVTIRNNLLENNAYSGLQINAVEDHPNTKAADPNRDSMSKVVVVTLNTLRNNQLVGGAGAMQFSGCYDLSVQNNEILGHNGRAGITLWDDGTGKPELACHTVNISDNAFEFSSKAKVQAAITVSKNCTDVTCSANTLPKGVQERMLV